MISVNGNIIKVCADKSSDVAQCSSCSMVGSPKMADWNEWDCSEAKGEMIFISNKSAKRGNYIIACEAEVVGTPI